MFTVEYPTSYFSLTFEKARFNTKEEAARFCFGYSCYYRSRAQQWRCFRVTDDLDLYFPNEVLKIIYDNLPKNNYSRWWFRSRPWESFEHRKGPVPHTAHRGGYSYFRNCKTFQEIRANDALYHDEDAIEYDIKPRRKNIPTDRDDMPRFDRDNRNWKRYRKHQWKGPESSF